MNWVSPIKDEDTLNNLLDALRAQDEKYYILFRVGVGTGLQVKEILNMRVGEILGKDEIMVYIGAKNLRRTYLISQDLKGIVKDYTKEMELSDYLIPGSKRGTPLTRNQAYRVIKSTCTDLGMNDFGALTMRKTFAWRYYKKTGDICYLQKLFNHSSSLVTFRFIGVKPSLVTRLSKMTEKENAKARRDMFKDKAGKARIQALRDFLNYLEDGIQSPEKEDRFYGAVDSLLGEVETLVREFKEQMGA
jgi:integrase